MAVGIQQRRAVRGCTAIAQRPNGTRASFIAYPTTMVDAAGVFIGAINLLLDITGWPEREPWLTEARRCRRLSRTVDDPQIIQILQTMAVEYETKARECVFATIPAE
jgi:hypothetical protein